MATESSAIARFVNLTQSQAIADPAREGIVDITQPLPPPGQPVPVAVIPAQARRPQATGSSSGMWLALVGFVVIGGAVAGGYLLAQQQSGDAKGPSLNTIGATTAGVAAPSPSPALEESPVPAAAPLDAGEDTIDPDLDPGLAAAEAQEAGEALPVLDVELAKKTGFDILVEPSGAKVSLDGHDIGSAPLRVRNLLPGLHGVDIEGPAGYFGKHMEFELTAGEAQVLELVLEAVDDDASAVPAADTALKVEPIVDVKNKSVASSKTKKKSSEDSRKSKKKAQAKTKSASKREASRASAVKALDSKGEVSLGTLMLGAKPPCQIMIDGKNTGLTTPQRTIQLPEGAHRVVLVNDEHGIKKAFKVNIKAGRTTRAIQDLSTKL